MSKTNFVFLTVGKTTESKEAVEFKRYIGVGTSKVLAVNPDKKTLDDIMGFESQSEPQYVAETEEGKEARITFIVGTVPEDNNGVDIKNRLMFTLRNTPAYNRDKTKVQVIDAYGNTSWMATEDAKAGNKPLSANGSPLRIADKYRMAYQGEPELVDFLKTYLGVGSAFNYSNGQWILKSDASDFLFSLEHIKDYFNGDFKELRQAIALQPNNKVKLLYGVRTTDEGKQYQAIASRHNMFLRNSAGDSAYERLAKELASIKQAGAYANTEFKVSKDLVEYDVQATDLSKPVQQTPAAPDMDDDLPW